MSQFSKVREPFPNVYFVLAKSLETRGCLPDDGPLTGRPQRMLWRRAIEKPSLEVVDLSPRSSAQCPVLPCFNDPFFLAGSPVCTTLAAAQASPKRAARERLSLGAAASWEGLEPRQGLLASEDLLSAPLWLLPKPPIKRTGTSARRIPSPSSSTGPRFKKMVSITSTQADGQRVRLHLPLRSSLAFLDCKVLPSRWRKPFCSVPCMSPGMPRMLSECASP
ncbi:uncharacterized protein LOC132593091 [Zootoca vivipara]|uniref:uncharacterized protein LOC132593091 n=1 Tax=Zootoca vivipara TaxID=8524 RepID=UPI00293BA1B2|nr:uncharacterized protein LOC132593091 [Zootoca vivipara]